LVIALCKNKNKKNIFLGPPLALKGWEVGYFEYNVEQYSCLLGFHSKNTKGYFTQNREIMFSFFMGWKFREEKILFS